MTQHTNAKDGYNSVLGYSNVHTSEAASLLNKCNNSFKNWLFNVVMQVNGMCDASS